MTDEEALHRRFTKFMLDTSRYTKTQYMTDANVYSFLVKVLFVNLHGDVETLMSGSSAEFYIKQMLSCIGDVDTMVGFNRTLAIPPHHTPPTELPGHYQDTVNVVNIVNSHKPGHVYLKHSCTIRKNDNGRYDVEHRKKEAQFFSLFDDIQIDQILQDFFGRTNYEIRSNPLVLSLLTPVYSPHGPAFFW